MHRANGGYLLLDMPAASCSRSRSAGRRSSARCGAGKSRSRTSRDSSGSISYGIARAGYRIPLHLKVVLFGDRLLYFLLAALDPELAEHFKVLADFENDLARTPENEAILARLLATLSRRDELRPLDRDAVARVLEHAARLADHAGKLSLVARAVAGNPDRGGLLRSVKASAASSPRQRCGACRGPARIWRAARLRDRAQEAILERVALIETRGRFMSVRSTGSA